MEKPKRLIRARALEASTQCLYANRNIYEEYFNNDDKERFTRLIKPYTDFEAEGSALLQEVEKKK